ncbi:MAG: hypothetical protein DNFNHJIP_00529 [Candidatus Argoarchaeum ethanivorans]|uniref:Uncharacterized protein n=1 Tax=Candidatus Argoarchaeum ethanivorans TaxID=2608793 RepID=A0A812A292_9EURY|nr:MAG: hypothetical protein DNFNHJIP_00529 [Candidatus Argoarchaeum ethanivorans]
MEKYNICGKEFEPINLPIEPKIWDIKPPHRAICPVCFLQGIQDTFRLAIELLLIIRLAVKERSDNLLQEETT